MSEEEQSLKRPPQEELIGPNPIKLQKISYEDLLLDNLPCSDTYQMSYMHRDTINNIACSAKQDVVVTVSIDGHIKFWRKAFHLIDPTKNFKAHNGLITGVSFSRDHDLFCSVGIDKTLKIFDVMNCDLRTVIKLSFAPSCCEFLPQKIYDWQLIAVAQDKTGKIHIVDPEGAVRNREKFDDGEEIVEVLKESEPKKEESVVIVETLSFHKHPIKAIKMNWKLGVCFSIDERAFLQVWDAFTFDFPSTMSYSCKIKTDFLKLLAPNSAPLCLAVSPKGTYLAVMLKDKLIRIFGCLSGKCTHIINESLKDIINTQEDPTADHHAEYVLGQAEYEKKLAIQKEIQISKDFLHNPNVEFDQSEEYLVYPSFHGIKVYSLKERTVERILGKKENERFIRISIYQGKTMRNPTGSSNLKGERKGTDPTIYCTAFKRPRFFIFSKRSPEVTPDNGLIRDIINERFNKEETQIAAHPVLQEKQNEVLLQTTLGDIHVLLFTEECPKTCENFIKLTKKGFYNGLIFHRVVKGFMNQTGCPKGDGTGGESIWGGYFEDELRPEKHRFDKPYVLAMANRGPNTNGAQFFITVVACPWLDNKHTIFGRVVKGIETVCEINKLKTDKLDKPLMNVKIMNAKVMGAAK